VEAKTAPKNLAGDVKGLLGTSAQILTSNGAMLSALGAQAWRGDVILLGEAHNFDAGEVWFHLSDGGACLTCMVRFPLLKVGNEKTWARYSATLGDEPELVATQHIVCSAVHRRSENSLTCLWPIEYRDRYGRWCDDKNCASC
jgi:hypothetical protein